MRPAPPAGNQQVSYNGGTAVALTWDAEGRLASSTPAGGSATTYVYGADGQRAGKIVGGAETNYVRDLDGSLLVTYVNGSFNNGNQELWVGGKHFGTVSVASGSATTQTQNFSLTNWLGTEMARTDPSSGIPTAGYISQPFGDAQTTLFGADTDPLHFTGKERDTESGNDYFGARYYQSSMGRFMSPDPSALYYADPNNPQSLNLYSYVLNNPLRNVDPDGLSCYWDDGTHDDDPSDGGASQGDCASQGGTWIDKPTTFVSVTANPNNDDISTTTVTISTPLGYQQCQPASFRVTGVGPGQAPGNGAFTGQPPANGQVAIKPQNFGVPYNTKAQRKSAQQLGVSSVVSNIVIFPNYGTNTAPLPKNTPQTPFGAPSGPLTPADAIGPASVRNSPGNQIDVYRYDSQRDALSSTRTTTPTVFVPINSVGVGCPN